MPGMYQSLAIDVGYVHTMYCKRSTQNPDSCIWILKRKNEQLRNGTVDLDSVRTTLHMCCMYLSSTVMKSKLIVHDDYQLRDSLFIRT